MTTDNQAEANIDVKVLSAVLSSRDASFDELVDGDTLSSEFYDIVPLERYLESTRIKGTIQEGRYSSIQGVNMTPLPCWSVEFQTARRRAGGSYQIIPKRSDGMYEIATSRRAEELQGPGQSKKRWRGTRLEGACSLDNLYTVVTSTYLVPFAIGHRYVAHLPASVNESQEKERNATLITHHEYANIEDEGLGTFEVGQMNRNEDAIKSWTQKAQSHWIEKKTEGGPDLVTERLDDYNKLSQQQPRSFRVVHTRSRKLYAGVLDPHESTALGLSFGGAEIHSRVDANVTNTDRITAQGVICDNKLHYINTDSEGEAYWLMGVLNSTHFEDRVMEHASGDPPGIYSMPAKILDRMGLIFDPEDQRHVDIADLAAELETAMEDTIRDYIRDEKDIDLGAIDDSDTGPEIPSMISTPYTNRFNQDEKLQRLDDLVETLIDGATA